MKSILRRIYQSVLFRSHRFSLRVDQYLTKSWVLLNKKHYLKYVPTNPHLKIALVKQEVYQNLYNVTEPNNLKSLITSAVKHTGMAGLLTNFKTDFVILKVIEDDEECNVWKEKSTDCKQQNLEFYYNLITKPLGNNINPLGYYSVSADSVDWGKYDVVIGIDISIPARIVAKYPDTKWCYYIGEPCQHSYHNSYNKPIAGYDYFFTQKMFSFRVFAKSKKVHVKNVPFNLQYYGCFHEAFNQDKNSVLRSGIYIDSHSYKELDGTVKNNLQQFGEVVTAGRNIDDILKKLMHVKYFIRLGGRIVWGNSMIEAISAGCLVIGNPKEFVNYSLFTKRTSISNYNDMINRIRFFENNPIAYKQELEKQRALVNGLCFTLPLSHVFKIRE